MAMSETTASCERCGNPVTERESIWVQGPSGRLRITTLAETATWARTDARFWHAGCLHKGPYP
jgi:hypothetical protein